MFKQLILLLAFSASAFSLMKKGLRGKFDMNPMEIMQSKSFFPLPETTSAAEAAGWTQKTPPENSLIPNLTMYCKDSCKNFLCILYDCTGYVAGCQFAILKENITESPFDMETLGYDKWITTDNNNNTATYMYTTAYFGSKENLSNCKAERIAARDSDKILQEPMWLTGFRKKLCEVPLDIKEFKENTSFEKQNYMPGMGRHHFWNMTKSLSCTSETIFPYFTLHHKDELVGFGWVMIGKIDLDENNDCKPENPPEAAVKFIVPNGPECLYNYAKTIGLNTFHIYFIDNPLTLIWE